MTNDDLVFLSAKVAKNLEAIIAKRPQSIMLIGSRGVGLESIAKNLADQMGGDIAWLRPEKDEKVDLESGIISVDLIRRVYDMAKLKKTSPLVIVIDYAERMNRSAQNAFLKLLEEPGENTYFVMLATSSALFLPTILSRVEKIAIDKITKAQSEKLLLELGISDSTVRQKILFLANGLPDEIKKLALDIQYLEKKSKIAKDAKSLISGSSYDKLTIAFKYKNDRAITLVLLDEAINMLDGLLIKSPTEDMLKLGQNLLSAYENLISNSNIRLTLSRLAL